MKTSKRKSLNISKGVKLSRVAPNSSIKSDPPIKIERPIHHIGKGGSFYRTSFLDLDGNTRVIDIPRTSFSTLSDAISFLLNEHAKLPTSRDDQKQCIRDALEAMGNKPTLNITDRVGWNSTDGIGASFVYYGKTFGADTLQLEDDSLRNAALGRTAGKLEDWRTGLEEPCRFSDHLVLAISIAASGPLYGIIRNPEPAIYHFQGARKPTGDGRVWKSSSGKTLTARGGLSTFSRCERTDLFGFNTTALALEETCFSCNNLVVVLDEQGTAGEGGQGKELDPKTIPYRIIGGQGKRRSKNYTSSQNLSNRSWVVPVITTAEDELDVSGSVRKEGAQVRMVAVPFPPTWAGGTFSTVDSFTERNRLAQLIETTITANYGVMMPSFLSQLTQNQTALATDILAMRDKFVRDVGATGNIWEKRYAEKFGMPLAAALLLVRYGIAPWTGARAIAAVTNMYKASRGLTVSVTQATDALLNKLRKLVAAKKRFPRAGKGKSLSPDQKREVWGVVREIGGKMNVTAVRPTRFRKLVQPSAVSDQVLTELAERKLLIKDADGNTSRQVLIKGLTKTRARYICIKGLVANTSTVKFKKKSKMA